MKSPRTQPATAGKSDPKNFTAAEQALIRALVASIVRELSASDSPNSQAA